MGRELTLGEEATVAIAQVFAQKPTIAKLVVTFKKLDTVAFP